MTDLPVTPSRSTDDRNLRAGGGLTAAEWMARPELKYLPVLASNDPLLVPTDVESTEWKSLNRSAFGQ